MLWGFVSISFHLGYLCTAFQFICNVALALKLLHSTELLKFFELNIYIDIIGNNLHSKFLFHPKIKGKNANEEANLVCN